MCGETLRYLPIFILPYDLKVWLARVRQHTTMVYHIFSCHTHFIHKLAVHKLAGP